MLRRCHSGSNRRWYRRGIARFRGRLSPAGTSGFTVCTSRRIASVVLPTLRQGRSDYTRRAVARILPTLLVLALLGCTAAAFAVTEGLKLEKSPIGRTRVDKVIAPRSTAHPDASIQFFLRKSDRVSVVIVNSNGDVVRTLGMTRRARRGTLVFVWTGRDAAGRIVPDGTYKPRVHLVREHRTIVLPNSISVDATAPLIKLVSITPRVFSPDGDFRREFARI